ncbi:helix-turn-helix domain-containing protein [Bradyrhizobium sp. S3.9.1]|uniref:helix-turn-helix domain-containing protein n=1 Tax=Bradyrhizobium sp. S3.9.1 TaxID=3156431 RepID=UPI003390F463
MSTLGKRLIKAAKNARKIASGEADPSSFQVHIPETLDVQKIRRTLGLSQEAFALRFGIPAATLRDWEQKRRTPEVSARILLKVIEKNPDAVTEALATA